MMAHESENIEFKSRMSENIYREVIAFANTKGGVIYLGIDDQGNLIGIDDVDETYTRLTNGIRDAIRPDVTLFVRYFLQENKVIRIEVQEGSSKPYFLKAKGLKSNGVFVRQGATSVQASTDQIRRMIRDSDGSVFEEMRAMEQKLTFVQAEQAFKRYGVKFAREQFITLGLRNSSNGPYTNLALLLSDQCPHTTKVAVFADPNDLTFKDSKEFGGSILKQLDDSFFYLSLCNRTAATFKGLERIEKSDYPVGAIREGLLNAFVHRDYSFSGSVIINVNDLSIEFISIGGLPPGLSPEDIRAGISQPRNRKLAEVFHRLKLIESYGTGIRRIFNLYKENPVQPKILVTPNTFKLVLPNMNAEQPIRIAEPRANYSAVTPQMKVVLDYISQHGEMTDAELQQLLDVKKTRSYLIARQMSELGLIEIKGRGMNKKCRLR